MVTRSKATDTASEQWCNESITLPNGRVLVCERGPHPLKQGEFLNKEDTEDRLAHEAWYRRQEYMWGGVPDDKEVKIIEQGFRVMDERNGTRAIDLCGRELYRTISISAGVTTLSGHLIGIKHFAEDDNPTQPRTKLRIKRGEDIKTITLEKDIRVQIYKTTPSVNPLK